MLESNVKKDLKPRLLPNGKEFCAEDAITEEQKDACTGDLEDIAFAGNRDKERAKDTLRKGIARLKLARNPCSWFERVLRKDRCTVK